MSRAISIPCVARRHQCTKSASVPSCGWMAVWPPSARADRPGTAHVPGSAAWSRCSCPCETSADRMDRRQIDDVKAHFGLAAAGIADISEGAMPAVLAARARKKLMPGAEPRLGRISHDGQRLLRSASHARDRDRPAAIAASSARRARSLAAAAEPLGSCSCHSSTSRGLALINALLAWLALDKPGPDAKIERHILPSSQPLLQIAIPGDKRVDPPATMNSCRPSWSSVNVPLHSSLPSVSMAVSVQPDAPGRRMSNMRGLHRARRRTRRL